MRYTKALCWACALLLLAAGNAAGIVSDESARVLFIVLPLVAWLSVAGSASCLPGGWRTNR